MSVTSVAQQREELITELAEVVGNKYCNLFNEMLSLPGIAHDALYGGGNYSCYVKFPLYNPQNIKHLKELWLNNSYTPSQIEDDIKFLQTIAQDLESQYSSYSQIQELRDLLTKYKD